MAENRLIGDYPVIGIRPTIDGRRGPLKVRESLEEQTMNMAKSAAELFRQNLKYSNGEPVKVVIADTTIGRVAETAACADKFRKEGVDITLTVTPCCAMVLKLWIWISIRSRVSGDLTEQKDRVLYILQQFSLHMHKKDCRHLVFMEEMFRKQMRQRFRKM